MRSNIAYLQSMDIKPCREVHVNSLMAMLFTPLFPPKSAAE